MHIHKKDLIATIKLNAEEINLDTANQLLKDPTLKPCHIIIHLEGVTELDEEQLDALFYLSEMVPRANIPLWWSMNTIIQMISLKNSSLVLPYKRL